MGRLTLFIFLCIVSVSAVAQSESQQPPRISPSQIDTGTHRWIAGALNAIQTIKVGMTRSDLLKVFTIEGGLSTTSQRTYVYRQCPYIKVDVKFAASNRDEELPTEASGLAGISGRAWFDRKQGPASKRR